MERIFLAAGAISGFLAVALGAFGAHALKARLTPDLLDIFEVGVRYQMYHALAIIAVAWASLQWPGGLTRASGWLFIAGTLIFSGSLYILAVSGVRWLGAITPIGGLAFLGGWVCLVIAAIKAS